ncbi:MAG: hypothetical protein ACFBSE_13235 [Prochloraceae cyanobacterium]
MNLLSTTTTLTTGMGAVSDSQIESKLGLAPGSLDQFVTTIPQGNDATEGQVIAVKTKGDVDLTFNYDFSTGEFPGSSFNDFSFSSVNQNINLIAFDDQLGTVPIDLSPGTNTIGIGVMDEGDTVVDSTLAITSYDLSLSNGPGSFTDAQLETFLGLDTVKLDNLGNGNATEGSAAIVGHDVTLNEGQALTIDYNFTTSEALNSFFNDFAFISFNSEAPNMVMEDYFELADTSSPGMGSLTLTVGATGDIAPGTYDIGVGVVDVGDTIVNSSLTVTDITIV